MFRRQLVIEGCIVAVAVLCSMVLYLMAKHWRHLSSEDAAGRTAVVMVVLMVIGIYDGVKRVVRLASMSLAGILGAIYFAGYGREFSGVIIIIACISLVVCGIYCSLWSIKDMGMPFRQAIVAPFIHATGVCVILGFIRHQLY